MSNVIKFKNKQERVIETIANKYVGEIQDTSAIKNKQDVVKALRSLADDVENNCGGEITDDDVNETLRIVAQMHTLNMAISTYSTFHGYKDAQSIADYLKYICFWIQDPNRDYFCGQSYTIQFGRIGLELERVMKENKHDPRCCE